ncbi:lytic transglycosylase domain-containing protein [Nocardiopsis sp. NPDC006139]|uniref:lytic transglycosylase domain-containing protein n=1 Tax=unclassified Nocardiopsis TaxID=2649073 RepID=UPI0033AFBDDA
MKQLLYLPLALIAFILVFVLLLVGVIAEEADGSFQEFPDSVPGIPDVVLFAYVAAASGVDEYAPGCEGMSWSLVAGIGYEESKHGTHDGAEADEEGNVRPPIIGIPLDGTNDTARIEDTDDGEMDGDEEFDRAVGPMQFIPGSWNIYGQDGDGNGEKDPNNIFDAAAATVAHLCRSGGNDLTTDEKMRQAIRGYNNSGEYVNDVMERKAHYDSLHVRPDGGQVGGGEMVSCANLGQLHPTMCSVHEHLNEKFGAFYLSAGGYRNESTSDHGYGMAIDYMMGPYGGIPSMENHAMAIQVINYVIKNHEILGVKGLIYDRHIWNAQRDSVGDWNAVRRFHQNTGDLTQDHVDHIHLAAGPGRMR